MSWGKQKSYFKNVLLTQAKMFMTLKSARECGYAAFVLKTATFFSEINSVIYISI